MTNIVKVNKNDCPFCGERTDGGWKYHDHVSECAAKMNDVTVDITVTVADKTQTHTVFGNSLNAARGKALNFLTFIEKDWEV